VTRRTLRAALVAVWGWGALNALSSAPTAARSSAPYLRFAGRSFEPSAASFDPVTRRVLVLSDADTTLYRYELGPAGLTRPRGETHESLRLPAGIVIAKLEGMTRLPTGDFLAVTAFDHPDSRYRRLLRFSYGDSALTETAVLALDEAALETAVREVAGRPLSGIDAVAVDRTGTKVLLGIRDGGETPEARRDVGLVARCPLDEGRVGAPEAVVRLSAAETVGDPTEAMSDLQLDAGGDSFLVLTRDDGTMPDRPSGHLFRVPASVLLGVPPLAPFSLGGPLREFRARPEGLAVEPSGALVVVFDDRDAEYPAAGHESSNGLFAVIDPAP
jgi:hypothetical protein